MPDNPFLFSGVIVNIRVTRENTREKKEAFFMPFFPAPLFFLVLGSIVFPFEFSPRSPPPTANHPQIASILPPNSTTTYLKKKESSILRTSIKNQVDAGKEERREERGSHISPLPLREEPRRSGKEVHCGQECYCLLAIFLQLPISFLFLLWKTLEEKRNEASRSDMDPS